MTGLYSIFTFLSVYTVKLFSLENLKAFIKNSGKIPRNVLSFLHYTSTKSRRGYIFTAVCLCVCLSVCLSVCLCVCLAMLVNKIPAEQDELI